MSKRQKIIIRWSQDVAVEDIAGYQERKNDDLYFVLRKRRILFVPSYLPLYIGMTYRQSLYERLKNHHKLPKIIDNKPFWGDIILRFGQLILPPNRRMSEKLVDDVESLLIYQVKPPYNVTNRSSYNRRKLAIRNMGKFRPLPKYISSD